jgi:exodeoxyribonuclease III
MSSPKNSSQNLKIVTWNVNGIRAFSKKSNSVGNFETFIEEHSPDVVCFQEIKIDNSLVSQFKHFLGPNYPFSNFNCCTIKKGYSGTAIFSKEKPLSIRTDFPLNTEGRVIVAEFESCFVVNSYVPNSGMKNKRLKYRTEIWDPAFQKYLNALDSESTKPVIWTGDMNVAHGDNDIYNPKKKRNKAPGFNDAERENLGLLIGGAGHITEHQYNKRTSMVGRPGPNTTELPVPLFVDAFSLLHGNWEDSILEGYIPKRRATYWSYRFNGKARDNGWRIDYFIISRSLSDSIVQCEVYEGYHGLSDHCPLMLEFVK